MYVPNECCVFSGRGLCGGSITRPEESYRVCVSECDAKHSHRSPWTTGAVEPRNFFFSVGGHVFEHVQTLLYINCSFACF
jgi:hypothetical protein